jgi:DNA-binding transcriptional ArsR family regulator
VQTYQQSQLDALGDPTRRAILARLIQGPLPVGELARDFPISRPAISQHLRVLKQAHLVTGRAAGNRRLYQLDPEGFETVREYFDQFWGQALTAFARRVAAVEASRPKPKRKSKKEKK